MSLVENRKFRNFVTVVGQNLLCQGFVAGECEPPRITARIGLFPQFKIADDMLIEMTDAAKFLYQVESDSWFVRIDGAPNGREVVGDANRKYVMSESFNRIPNIKLCLAQFALFFAEIFEVALGQKLFICQQDDA